MRLRLRLRDTILLMVAVLLFAALSGASALYYRGQMEIGRVLIEDILNLYRERLLALTRKEVGKASYTVSLIRDMNASGLISHGDGGFWGDDSQQMIVGSFRHTLLANPQFTSIYFGDRDGNFLMLHRMEDGGLSTKQILRSGGVAVTRWQHQLPGWEESHPPLLEESAESAYDPRSRPWYQMAWASDGVVWTDVYRSVSTGRSSFAVAARLMGESGPVGVFGIDISLIDLSGVMSDMVSRSARSFVVDEQGRLIAVTANALEGMRSQIDFDELPLVSELPAPELVAAYEQLNGSGGVSSEFRANGQSYVGVMQPVPVDVPWRWSMVVYFPISALIGHAIEVVEWVAVLLAIALLLLMLVGWHLASAVAKPLQQLGQQMVRVREFEIEDWEPVRSRVYEVNEIASSFEAMVSGLRSFEKYVPRDLVLRLMRQREVAAVDGQMREITVLFSDLAGFTRFAEEIEPADLVRRLNRYLAGMSGHVAATGGNIDKYIGDGLMAYWNAPESDEEHAIHACRAALGNLQVLQEVNDYFLGRGQPPLRMRTGIHTGLVLIGNFGSEHRLN